MLSMEFAPPPTGKEFCMGWWPGNWVIYYSTHHVKLLNLLAPDAFTEVKMVKKASAVDSLTELGGGAMEKEGRG